MPKRPLCYKKGFGQSLRRLKAIFAGFYRFLQALCGLEFEGLAAFYNLARR